MLPFHILLLAVPVLAAAATTLNSNPFDVNRSFDPCLDFYQFACSNWMEKHPIPPTKSSLSSFQTIGDRIENQLRSIVQNPKLPGMFPELSDLYVRFQDSYRSCMDTAGIDAMGLEPLRDFLQGFLGLSFRSNRTLVDDPQQQHQQQQQQQQLQRGVEYLHAHGISVLFGAGVGADERNATVQAISLSQTSHAMPKGDYQNATKVHQYKEIVRSILDTMSQGLHGLLRGEDAEEIVSLEKELESVTVPS